MKRGKILVFFVLAISFMSIVNANSNFTLLTPINNSRYNTNPNFTVNITDSLGIKNATLNIYNSSNLVNQTTTIFNETIVYTLLGNVVNLSDGTYYWFYSVFDLTENESITQNNTVLIDKTLPIINITYPLNLTYNLNVSFLNYTIIETNPSRCWYSNNSGIWNSTSVASGTNWTVVLSKKGSNTWTVYCNDSFGNINSVSRVFFKNTTYPFIDYRADTIADLSYLPRGESILVHIYSTDPSASIQIDIHNSTSLIGSVSGYNEIATTYTPASDGNYYFNSTAIDGINESSTETRKVTRDTINPLISYGNGTQTNRQNRSENFVYVNVSFSEINFANITFTLYNLTQLVNSTTLTNKTYSINWTNLPRTNYTYFVNITDLANNKNSTEVYSIKLEYKPCFINLISSNLSRVTSSLDIYYKNGTLSNTFFSDGNYSLEFRPYLIDLLFNSYDNRLKILFFDMDTSLEYNKTIGLDKPLTPISGYLATYGVKNIDNLNFTNSTLMIYYDNLAYSNENNLKLDKCNNWNFTSQICSGGWNDITNMAFLDTTNNHFEITLTNLSGGFSIREVAVSPSSGGGGGGGSTIKTLKNESFWIKTYDLKTSNLSKGINYSLASKERILINIANENPYIGIISTSVDLANIQIVNRPANVTFKINEEKKFDTNSNNIYDLVIKLNSIVNGKANISVRYITEPINETLFNNVIEKSQESPIKQYVPKKIFGLSLSLFYAFVVLILLTGVVIFLIIKNIIINNQLKLTQAAGG